MRPLIILLVLATPLAAKPVPVKPAATPAPAMAPARTAQQELELRDWISGIVTTAHNAEASADKADAEAKTSRDQSAIAGVKLEQTQTKLDEVQQKYDAKEAERAAAVEAKKKEKKAREAADAHVSRIKNWLGFALGAVFMLAAQYIPWSLFPPPTSVYGRIGGSVLAFGLGYFIVARVV